MPEAWSRRSTHRIPTALLVLGAPALGLVFLVTLPILGLAALGWGLARPHPATPARPADGPEAGHPEPRHATLGG